MFVNAKVDDEEQAWLNAAGKRATAAAGMSTITLQTLHQLAEDALLNASAGEALQPVEIALIRFGLASSVTSLNGEAIDSTLADAKAAGATTDQLQEVMSLISGLGVHTLMIVSDRLARSQGVFDRPLTDQEQELWDRYVGDDPFWAQFESNVPGFLGSMLRLSGDQFAAFFEYCAVPWKSGKVRARLKELIAMASDATPAHRFLPGFKLHLANAIALGAGRIAVRQALDLAAAAPEHEGSA